MKIIFIVVFQNTMPWAIGPRTISSRLKEKGFHVKMLFLGSGADKIPPDFEAFIDKADLIGLSVMTNSYHASVFVTETIRRYTNAPILWGGVHATIRPEECLKHADIVCIGEGEESVVELAEKMHLQLEFTAIPGLWFRKKSEIIRNQIRPLMRNLDTLPFPDWDFASQYVLENNTIKPFDQDLFRKYCWYPLKGAYPMITSRGCPYNCSYCCNSTFVKMWPENRKIRKRSVEHIIEELVQAKKKIPSISCVHIDDDAFMVRSDREIEEFSRQFKKKIGVPLAVFGITPETYTHKKFSALISAGMCYVRIGIQSACRRTKKMYKRHYSNARVLEVARDIEGFRNEIKQLNYDIIIDNPWETEKDLTTTLRFLSRLPVPYFLSLFSLRFYPGTELYFKAKEDGMILDESAEIYERDYFTFDKSYLNGVFMLLHLYAEEGRFISPASMFILTNQIFRWSGFSRILFLFLANRIWKSPEIPEEYKKLLRSCLKTNQ